MREYIINCLSKSYEQSKEIKNGILAIANVDERARKILVFPEIGYTKSQFSDILIENMQKQILVVPIFYRNGVASWVRMGAKAANKADDRSLKKYTHEQINKMIHLKPIEKEALHDSTPYLCYYQPQTENIPESLKVYQNESVWLDYSHIDQSHRSYSFAKEHNGFIYAFSKTVVLSGCKCNCIFNTYKL